MLDECKGEKFEEVLGAFSTLVLQRVFEAEQNPQPSRVRRLVLAQRLTSEEQQSLLPLAIAHRSSLSALLRKKARLRLKYREFKTVLDAKELEIRTKVNNLEISKASEKRVGPTENLGKLKEYFDFHWQGDPKWIDDIFGQGKEGINDPLLDTPFSDSWTRLTDSTVDRPAPKQQGLLSQLEERVAAQEARLKQWKQFREDLEITSTKVENGTQKTKQNQVFDLKFSSHVELDLEPGSTREEVTQDSAIQEFISATVTEYQGLMGSMRRELAAVDAVKHGSNHDHTAASKQPCIEGLRQLSSSMGLDVAKRGHLESLGLPVKANSRTERRRNYDFKTKRIGTDSDQQYSDSGEFERILSRPEPKGSIKRLGAPERFSNREGEKSEEISGKPPKEPPVPAKLESDLHEVISSSEDSRALSSKSDSIKSGQEDEASTDLDEEEILAQRIIRSTIKADSPVKTKLSLLERTRQSMALVKPEEKDRLPESATAASTSIISIAENTVPSSDSPVKRRETLLERTRQSMSLIPPKPPPQKGIEQRRTSKIYPTNQFETPGKQQSRPQKDEESTPPESLFEQDANYASVFKSRPKVALSPTATSVRMRDELDDIIERESSEDDDDDDGAFVRGSNSSPSVRAKERNKRS